MRVPFSGRGLITCTMPGHVFLLLLALVIATKRPWSSPTGLTPQQKGKRQYGPRALAQRTPESRKRLDFDESGTSSGKTLWSKEEEGSLVDYVISRRGPRSLSSHRQR